MRNSNKPLLIPSFSVSENKKISLCLKIVLPAAGLGILYGRIDDASLSGGRQQWRQRQESCMLKKF
jgi:hypothetical protein